MATARSSAAAKEIRLDVDVDASGDPIISDTGEGIDPSLLLHVFKRFRQARR